MLCKMASHDKDGDSSHSLGDALDTHNDGSPDRREVEVRTLISR